MLECLCSYATITRALTTTSSNTFGTASLQLLWRLHGHVDRSWDSNGEKEYTRPQ
jgi:hypothetical protein